MTPLQMIAEWRKGCSCAPKDKPEECHECTRGLIEAMEKRLAEYEADKARFDRCDATHDVPLVVNHKAPGDLAVGDYVFASRWSDCDPGDPWAVGHISELGSNFVVVGEVNQRRWPKAMRISEEQGRRIVEQYPPMEADYQSISYKAIARVFGVPDGS